MYTDYDMLNSVNSNNLTNIKNSDDSDILSLEDTKVWLQELVNGSNIYIDFELSIIDSELSAVDLLNSTEVQTGTIVADTDNNLGTP